jgi:hypothetical protein
MKGEPSNDARDDRRKTKTLDRVAMRRGCFAGAISKTRSEAGLKPGQAGAQHAAPLQKTQQPPESWGLTRQRVNVIKHELESPRAEDAGFRLKVEGADGFSVLLAVNPCLVSGAVDASGDVAPPAPVRNGVRPNWCAGKNSREQVGPELEIWTEDL